MNWFQAIFLAIVQGLSEFLPISSSGHLAIFEHLFKLPSLDKLILYDVLLHLGTLFSVCIAFWKDICEMAVEFGRLFMPKYRRKGGISSARRLIFLLIVATLPLVLIVFFKDNVQALKNNLTFVGAALIATGALLLVSDRMQKGNKTEKNATVADVIMVGVMQAIATIPGLSRSGSTISTGLFRGFDRQFAIRFSFLMSIPAVVGANILSIKDAVQEGVDTTLMPIPMLIAGMLVSAAVGYLAIRLVKLIADKGNFSLFSWYCFVAGTFTVIISLVT